MLTKKNISEKYMCRNLEGTQNGILFKKSNNIKEGTSGKIDGQKRYGRENLYSKMAKEYSIFSGITLNVNGSNSPTSEIGGMDITAWNTICCLQEPHLNTLKQVDRQWKDRKNIPWKQWAKRTG